MYLNKKKYFHGSDILKLMFEKKTLLQNKRLNTANSSLLDYYLADNDTEKNSKKVYVLKRTCEALRSNISTLRHISAIRQILPEDFNIETLRPNHIGSEGEYTLPILYAEIFQKDDKERKLFDKYLSEILGIVEVQYEHIGDSHFKFSAFNRQTKARVNIAEFGFGASQCLPIVTQGLIMHKWSHLILEQPEAQVHPTAQFALGNFFADLWIERKVGTIVETHSSNLLLRISRMIATEQLSHNDVSVAYFTCLKENPTMPAVINLDFDKDGEICKTGEIEKGLPMEFFGSDLKEVLAIFNKE